MKEDMRNECRRYADGILEELVADCDAEAYQSSDWWDGWLEVTPLRDPDGDLRVVELLATVGGPRAEASVYAGGYARVTVTWGSAEVSVSDHVGAGLVAYCEEVLP